MSTDVPGRPGHGRRPTKAERKEDARKEREAIKQRMSSRRRRNRIGLGLIASGVVVAGVAVFTSSGSAIATPQELLQRAGRATEQAGCDAVQTTAPYDPEDQDRVHIDPNAGPPLSTYPTTPPASGPHADIPPGPLPAGVYTSLTLPDLYRAIHSLEHGATIVWYDPAAPAERVGELTAFYDRRLQDATVGQDRVIVAPYNFPGDPAGLLPEGREMALTAWHRLQLCDQVDLAVAYDFTSQYSFPTSSDRRYAGEAPEAGASLG